jgi:hypothetical protein
MLIKSKTGKMSLEQQKGKAYVRSNSLHDRRKIKCFSKEAGIVNKDKIQLARDMVNRINKAKETGFKIIPCEQNFKTPLRDQNYFVISIDEGRQREDRNIGSVF